MTAGEPLPRQWRWRRRPPKSTSRPSGGGTAGSAAQVTGIACTKLARIRRADEAVARRAFVIRMVDMVRISFGRLRRSVGTSDLLVRPHDGCLTCVASIMVQANFRVL